MGQDSSITCKRYTIRFDEEVQSNYSILTPSAQTNGALPNLSRNSYQLTVNEFWPNSQRDSTLNILVRLDFQRIDCEQNSRIDTNVHNVLMANQNHLFKVLKNKNDGAIRGFVFLPDTSPIYINLVRMLWSHLQVVRSNGDKTSTWTTNENQIVGKRKFQYRWQGDTLYKFLMVEKQHSKQGMADSILYYNHFYITNSKHNRIQEISLEHSFFQFSRSQKIAHVTQKFYAAFSSVEQIKDNKLIGNSREADKNLTVTGKEIAISAIFTANERKKLINQNVLKSKTWEQLEEMIVGLDTSSISKSFDVLAQIRAFLVLYPEKTDLILQKHKQTNVSSRAFWVLNYALIDADTAPAWEAVEQILKDCIAQRECLKNILLKIAIAENVPQSICQRLLEVKLESKDEFIKSQAGLALTSALNSCCKNTGFADSIVLKLIAVIEKSPNRSMSDTIQILNELGNYGSDKFFSTIEGGLKSTQSEVKASAVYALRFLENTDPLLITAYQQCADHLIRRNILDALNARTATPLSIQFIANALCNEQSKALAEGMISILKKSPEDNIASFRNALNASDCKWSDEVKKLVKDEFKDL